MQEDFIARALDLFQVDHPGTPAATDEVDTRALAVLGVVAQILQCRVGRDGVMKLVGEALDAGSLVRAEEISVAAALSPVEQLAEILLSLLRGRDPMKPADAVAGHDEAGAMIIAGMAFLQERHGGGHMAGYAANLIRVLQEAVAAGEEPMSTPAESPPMLPPPAGIRNLTPNPRAGLAVNTRINVMSAFLRGCPQADAHADALASITASAMFLRERFGEPYAVGAIRHVEGTVSQVATLERWQPEGATRN